MAIKNLLHLSIEFRNYFILFRVSLMKLGNCEYGFFDLIKKLYQWCPSFLLKRKKKKDKGLNTKMINLNVSKIQGLSLHPKHHTDAEFLRHKFRRHKFLLKLRFHFIKPIYFRLKEIYNSCTW